MSHLVAPARRRGSFSSVCNVAPPQLTGGGDHAAMGCVGGECHRPVQLQVPIGLGLSPSPGAPRSPASEIEDVRAGEDNAPGLHDAAGIGAVADEHRPIRGHALDCGESPARDGCVDGGQSGLQRHDIAIPP